VRIAKEKQPPLLLLENVLGLLSIERGKVFQTFLEALGELGYICEWKILDSQFFAVPQQRKRLFIVAHFAGQRGGDGWDGTVFPVGDGQEVCVAEGGGEKLCSTLMASYSDRGGGGTYIVQPRQTANGGVRVCVEGVSVLLSRMGTEGEHVPCVLREGEGIRRLTYVECERLQGFPDNWTRYGLTPTGKQIKISNTQRYKTLGNAVTTTVITEIGKLILNFWQRRRRL